MVRALAHLAFPSSIFKWKVQNIKHIVNILMVAVMEAVCFERNAKCFLSWSRNLRPSNYGMDELTLEIHIFVVYFP